MLGLFIKVSNHSDQSRTVTIQKRVRRRMPVARGRILEPPPDRGSVRRTSRSKCGCPESLSCPKTPGLAVPLRLVLRTQPRSVPVLLVVVSRCARVAARLGNLVARQGAALSNCLPVKAAECTTI